MGQFGRSLRLDRRVLGVQISLSGRSSNGLVVDWLEQLSDKELKMVQFHPRLRTNNQPTLREIIMSVDLSEFDLADPTEFVDATKAVAESVHNSFGDKFSVENDGETYINVGVLIALVKANIQNSLAYGLLGEEKVGIELVKQSLTLTAMVDEAKSSV